MHSRLHFLVERGRCPSGTPVLSRIIPALRQLPRTPWNLCTVLSGRCSVFCSHDSCKDQPSSRLSQHLRGEMVASTLVLFSSVKQISLSRLSTVSMSLTQLLQCPARTPPLSTGDLSRGSKIQHAPSNLPLWCFHGESWHGDKTALSKLVLPPGGRCCFFK